MVDLSKYKLIRSDRKVDSSITINTYIDIENGDLHMYKNDKIYLGFTASASTYNRLDIHEMYVKIHSFWQADQYAELI